MLKLLALNLYKLFRGEMEALGVKVGYIILQSGKPVPLRTFPTYKSIVLAYTVMLALLLILTVQKSSNITIILNPVWIFISLREQGSL